MFRPIPCKLGKKAQKKDVLPHALKPGWKEVTHELDMGASAACRGKRQCLNGFRFQQNPRHHLFPPPWGPVCDHHSLLCSFCPVSKTPSWTGVAPVAPSWATGECRQLSLQTLKLMFQGILTSLTRKVNSHLCSCSKLVQRETGFWSRLDFHLGLQQCSGFFHLEMQSKRQRKTILFNHSFGPKEKRIQMTTSTQSTAPEKP